MPNQPKTPIRTVRVGDSLWEAAQDAAAQRGETVSDVVRRALEEYVAQTAHDSSISYTALASNVSGSRS